jgi:hypothetical protein
MVKTFGLTHVALEVNDAERVFRFCHEAFGMVRRRPIGARRAQAARR